MAVVVPFIGAAIGGAIGGAFLGVSAVSWGWIVGSLLASAIFKPPGQQGPRLEDLTIVGTDYGQAFPWVAGSPRLAPQYIWASAIREIPNTQKVGKGGSQKVTTYTYEVDVLVRLTENVTEGVARDWVNAELVRHGLTLKDGVWAGVTVYSGADDQLPDPVYEAAVGAGNAPAYRGGTTILIQGLQLGGGKQLPNLEHQITRTHVLIDDRIRLLVNWPDGDESDQSLYETGLPVTSVGGNVGDGLLTADFNTHLSNIRRYRSSSFTPNVAWPVTYEVVVEVPTFTSLSSIDIFQFAPNGEDFSGARYPVQFYISGVGGTGGGVRLISQTLGSGNTQLDYTDSVAITSYSRLHVAVTYHDDGEASMWVNGVRVKDHVVYPSDNIGAEQASIILGGTESIARNGVINYHGVRISRAEPYSGASFTPPTELTGDLTNANAPVEADAVPLDEVIGDLLERAGYSHAEFLISGLGDVDLHGYATGNVTSTRAHLETLRPFGLFESNCSDKLYIFPRATTPAGVIPWEDLGASETPGEPSDPFPLNIGNEVEVPAQIAVRYRNVLADWNTGTEFSDRINSSLVSTQTVDMPFGMTPAQAKKVADTILKDAMAGLGRATLRLGGRKHAKYEPGDILTTTAPDGTGYRFRIITKRDHIFMLEWEVALDDASALESEAITDEGYVSTEPLRVAPTEWEVLAIPPLQDSDATVPGPYVAITPAKNADNDEWPGAVFVRARLPEAFDQVFISGDVCVMGLCQTTLGDFAEGSTVLDWTQILRVRVRGELSSSNWDDFFADRTINAALVGDEPIRFMNADFVSTDGQFRIYDLSGFMRGQLGQEVQIDGHVASERFVLLNPSLRRMVNQTTDIGQEHQVKAVTLNLLLDSVTAEDFTDDGIALRPYSPVHLVALADTSGDIDLTWVRRSRLVARYTDQGVFAPLGEAAEAYRVKVYDGVTLVRTQDVTTQAWTYAAADIASDGFSSTDPITITVQQLSETVGEGFAATVETTAP